jgi:hypothetical protein
MWLGDVALGYRARAATSPRNIVVGSTNSRLVPEDPTSSRLHTASLRVGAAPSSMHPDPPVHL